MTNIHLINAFDRLEEAKFHISEATKDFGKAGGDNEFVVGSLDFIENYLKNVLDLAHKTN